MNSERLPSVLVVSQLFTAIDGHMTASRLRIVRERRSSVLAGVLAFGVVAERLSQVLERR